MCTVLVMDMKLIYGDITHVEMITSYRMKLWDDVGKFKSQDEFDQIYKLNKEYFTEHFVSGKIVVPMYLDSEDNIISIGIGVIIQKPIVNMENLGLEGFIFNMYTEEQYRKQGLATSILSEIYTFFKKKKVVKVSLDSNSNSINMYKKYGMKENNYYLEQKI